MKQPIPSAPLWLGLAGLLPFWGLALAVYILPPESLAKVLAIYGALILSFLGGIRWGLAVAEDDAGTSYGISVVPSLVGWALMFAPDPLRLAGLGVVIGAWGIVDQALVHNAVVPSWFGRLRVILSSGAGIALLLAAVRFFMTSRIKG